MKKISAIILVLVAFLVFTAIPMTALAGSGDVSAGTILKGGFWGPILSCTGGGDGVAITEKCDDICDFIATIRNIIYFALTLLVYVVVPIAIMAGGFLIMTTGGAPERANMGKNIITNAGIGLVIGLGAFIIVDVFFGEILKPTSTGTREWYQPSCSQNLPDYLRPEL